MPLEGRGARGLCSRAGLAGAAGPGGISGQPSRDLGLEGAAAAGLQGAPILCLASLRFAHAFVSRFQGVSFTLINMFV